MSKLMREFIPRPKAEGLKNLNGQERIRTSEAQVQQIYSLSPLATWVPTRLFLSRREELNPRPAVYKTAALPTELRRQKIFINITQ